MISLRSLALNLAKSNCFIHLVKVSAPSSFLVARTSAYSTAQNDLVHSKTKQTKSETISRAMQFYLKKLTESENVRNEKIKEYELGKQHLARMMGLDPDQMTDQDIKNSVAYLLPSGIFDTKARPFMKHPNEYFPRTELAAFSSNGRPIDSMFYTRAPKFHQLMHDMTKKFLDLNKLEDAMNLVKFKTKFNLINRSRKGDGEDDDLVLTQPTIQNDMIGYAWFEKDDLAQKLGTKVDDRMHEKFLIVVKKLASHPLASREENFIKQFQKKLTQTVNIKNITQPSTDENGRKFSKFSTYLRLARVDVILREGNGKVTIKSPEGVFDISYFDSFTHREAIIMPFKTVNRVNKFDAEITVNLGGMTLLAKCIRYAISQCLCSFVSLDEIEKLRISGLLTHDIRLKERKKPGQEGARRRYTWLKR